MVFCVRFGDTPIEKAAFDAQEPILGHSDIMLTPNVSCRRPAIQFIPPGKFSAQALVLPWTLPTTDVHLFVDPARSSCETIGVGQQP
jgi:hypothetical protein